MHHNHLKKPWTTQDRPEMGRKSDGVRERETFGAGWTAEVFHSGEIQEGLKGRLKGLLFFKKRFETASQVVLFTSVIYWSSSFRGWGSSTP